MNLGRLACTDWGFYCLSCHLEENAVSELDTVEWSAVAVTPTALAAYHKI